MPLPPPCPRLNGRKRVEAPSSRVVLATCSVSTAKWTIARRPRVTFLGSRSARYCSLASSTPCPVSAFLSSAVATGTPLTKSARSNVLFVPGS